MKVLLNRRARRRGNRRLVHYAGGFFRRVERLLPSEWANQNLRLPEGYQESEPGPVVFDSRPYLREPLDCLVQAGVRDIVFIAPTRTGKTFLLRMVFAYVVAVLRLPMMWFDATIDRARSISKKELQPMVESNPVLRERKPLNPDNYTNTLMLFPGAHFEMFGANSDAQASGETAAIVLGNEIGKWRDSTDTEASILEQSRHRTKSYQGERKHYYSTTPTVEDSIEWREYLSGDQRHYEVPCPECGELQELQWGGEEKDYGVWWPPEAKGADGSWDHEMIAEGVRYVCKHCAAKWTQEQLWEAVRDARASWRPSAKPNEPWRRSYHVNGLYGPLEDNMMAALVIKFLNARASAFFVDRRDFWNGDMGLPWVDTLKTITFTECRRLERGYLRGELPAGFAPDVLIFGADVQRWGLPWLLGACDWAGNVFIVDHGVCATFDDLERMQKTYAKLGTSRVIIDSSFEERRAETLEAIYKRRGKGWMAAKGMETVADIVRVEKTNAFGGSRLEKHGYMIAQMLVSTYDLKVEIEKRLSGEMDSLFFPQLPPLLATSEEEREQTEFYQELMSERRRPRKVKRAGKPAYEFVVRGANHRLDCLVYLLGLLFFLRRRQSAAAKRRKKEIRTG